MIDLGPEGVSSSWTEDRVITVCRRINNSSSELVYTGELIQGWDDNFAALWVEAMDEANLGEQESQAASGCSLLSALVERSVYASGAATDKAWGVLKTRKSACNFSARSGKGSSLVNSMHARIHFVKLRIGHRDG